MSVFVFLCCRSQNCTNPLWHDVAGQLTPSPLPAESLLISVPSISKQIFQPLIFLDDMKTEKI